ncbi:LD-carboxypeptidase [Candidatus Roizmanbacteria bacterium CG23_combo_of_CG06-09_8_20_14_all_35_49]|uniref:LD-carboxypeptidase n=1 Tax=Candidatus Roizmanbacteria bacterium CG23_combo_of_CG06-09_8_20_14_all_35_49 TaxID=1974863 RepID=A0A2G9Y6P2_9BACT|nr:MAG: LD-carboxypeptidase [Candidatus Roizmanbacteria bacterium CG23_combo_of_CG06-09_8_20_14_all_35_49]
MIPPKLKKDDTVRVIAPARSLGMSWIQEVKEKAIIKFEAIGLKLTFGKHVNEINEFDSSLIESRIEDLHDAFRDENVKLIITVIGGFNSNQLLKYIDYNLIKNNPKIICGYSDITALANAIYAKSGLITYSGPHFFNFGDEKSFDYTLEYFKKCFFQTEPYEIIPSSKWSDDRWANDQENRTFVNNKGFLVINDGNVSGTIVGANLCTLNLLQGTDFMPRLQDTILFIEDDYESLSHTFDRDLQSLIHQPGFDKVKGIVIGRFQNKSNMTDDLLIKIIKTKQELNNLPVIANADFGHTTPMITFPIGGIVEIKANKNKININILKH